MLEKLSLEKYGTKFEEEEVELMSCTNFYAYFSSYNFCVRRWKWYVVYVYDYSFDRMYVDNNDPSRRIPLDLGTLIS